MQKVAISNLNCATKKRSLVARTATSQQVRNELRRREEPMTEGEEAVALELTSLMEDRDRATMEQQDMETRLISLQISQLCQN